MVVGKKEERTEESRKKLENKKEESVYKKVLDLARSEEKRMKVQKLLDSVDFGTPEEVADIPFPGKAGPGMEKVIENVSWGTMFKEKPPSTDADKEKKRVEELFKRRIAVRKINGEKGRRLKKKEKRTLPKGKLNGFQPSVLPFLKIKAREKGIKREKQGENKVEGNNQE